MPKQGGKRVFLSFEYKRDRRIAQKLEKEARGRGYPARVIDLSLSESYELGSGEWQSKARKAIQGCQLFVVVLGQDTHNAPGVRREIRFAKQFHKEIIHILPPGTNWSKHDLITDRPLEPWEWKKLDPYFDSNFGRH